MTSVQRVAPTQKISDDASYPQRPPLAAGHAVPAIAAGVAPRAIPPTPYLPSGPAGRPPSAPVLPHAAYAPTPQPPRAPTAPPNGFGAPPQVPGPQLDDPALSRPAVARRPWGLIIAVLVVDLGLAVAGGWMLYAGLTDQPDAGATLR